MLNGRFVEDQARHLARRCSGEADPSRRIAQLYRLAFGRDPTPQEVALGLSFTHQADAQPRPAPSPRDAWAYGYGAFDAATGKVSFTPLPYFTGAAWKLAAHEPSPTRGRGYLDAKGGHPGKGSPHAVIRRWVAPRGGRLAIAGTLAHKEDGGDGIVARVVSTRHGELASWKVRKIEAETRLQGVEVKRG